MDHPAFTMRNPNRVRSLIGAFAHGNPAVFHQADGAGYAFLADRVLELDAINPQVVRDAVKEKSPKVIAVVHAETSTGVRQPLEDLSAIAKECGALFLVDMVTSLGGMDVSLDRMGIDAAYSGTQKC
ncbi:MAG: aminotransferase class V-fold PLP-dependent enzyme, partial [Desulfuromonadales bacterium]